MKNKGDNKFQELSDNRWDHLLDALVRWDRKLYISELLVCLLMTLVLVFMVRYNLTVSSFPLLKEGSIASQTVRVHRNIEIPDRQATEAEKLRKITEIPDVYDHLPQSYSLWMDRWKRAVDLLRVNYINRQNKSSNVLAREMSALLGFQLKPSDVRSFQKMGKYTVLKNSIEVNLAPVRNYYIVNGESFEPNKKIEVVRIQSAALGVAPSESKSVFIDPIRSKKVISLNVAREILRSKGQKKVYHSRWTRSQREFLDLQQSRLLEANLTLNRKETQLRRQQALEEFEPVTRTLGKGEVIIRGGNRVSAQVEETLQELNALKEEKESQNSFVYEVFFATFSLWLFVVFLRRQYPHVLSNLKDTLVTASFLVLSLSVFKFMLVFELDILAQKFSHMPVVFFLFIIPVAAPGMILRLLVPQRLTLVATVLYAIGVSVLLDHAALFGVYILTGSLSGAIFVKNCRTRTELYRAGLWTALVCGISSVALVLAWGGELPAGVRILQTIEYVPKSGLENVLWALFGGMLGGLLSSSITLVLTPLFENLLNYTTDLKLLELARMDHPLLRELVLKAPGTYHHSIIVGSLVEAGAEAIGANALLVRVGSYYHDIGKIGRAEYFVENQRKGRNPHDAMKPQLSAKIIISHVKEGRVMAEKYKLGKAMIDFIEQHHGTSLGGYFHEKAKKMAQDPETEMVHEEIREGEFRYPGPNPQSKEAAILALADACEASTRSLVEPTPARIEGMIKKIIRKALDTGLLNDADITLREVNLVGTAFLRILLGIHHNRIEYPDQEKDLPQKGEKKSESSEENKLSLVKN